MVETLTNKGWRFWLRGLIAAVVGAAANSVGVMIVDPQDFNLFDGGAVKLAKVAAVFALVAGAGYLKQHPVPEE